MNVALILAGGIGSRSGEKIPKQFVEINNKPLIIYTLEKFQNCSDIDEICIVCIKEWIEFLKDKLNEFKILKVKYIVNGGKNGLESVKNGLKAMDKLSQNDLVLIHDAVRPFIDNESINENIRVAKKYGMALTAVDLVETLVYSEDGCYSNKIINRDNLKRILTPQTFSYGTLVELYNNSVLDSNIFPSTFSLYMNKGLPVYCSKGSEKNIKITYPEDIQYFKKMFG